MNLPRFRLLSLAAMIVVAAFALVGAVFTVSASNGGAKGNGASLERTERSVRFRADMRKLWEDHIIWTREFIVAFAANSGDQDEVAARLLANQSDIGDAIKPYYGDDAGDALTELLREHILGAVALLQAAKAGDAQAFESARVAWYSNGQEIAEFLNAANPQNWPLPVISHHMTMHLDLTLQEAAHRLAGDFQSDITDYDAVHHAILEMADFLSLGIIHQFPKEFRGN
jgi:hypothetical protein